MLLQPTLARLRELRLTGMADALEEQQALPDIQGLSFEDRLCLIVARDEGWVCVTKDLARAAASPSTKFFPEKTG